MAVSNDVLSQTILAIEDETSMALAKATPFLSEVKRLGKVHSFDGSYALRIPVEVQEPSNTTVLDTGYEQIDLTARDATRYAQFAWGRFIRPVSISGRELAENAGEYQVVDLAETKYKSSMSGLMRQINRQVVAGNVTGFSSLGTLNGSTLNGTSLGFLEDAAVGSQTHVVGGLSKATYSSVAGWQNQFADLGASLAAADVLNALRSIRTGAAMNRPTNSDGKLFHVITATQDFFNAYEASLFANQRYVDEKKLDGGIFQLAYGDAAIVPDPDMTALQATIGNGDVMAYALNLDGITLAIAKGGDFKFSEFIKTPDQDVTTAHIVFMGGLIARNLGANGIITY